MATSEPTRLTLTEMQELERLAFASANYSEAMTVGEQRRYDELLNKERQTSV